MNKHKEVAQRNIYITQQIKNPQFSGLCINCAHKESCTLPKDENGVLYCEEYE